MSRALNTASADLTWLFTVAVTSVERSTLGPQLDRLELYSVHAPKAVGETMALRETRDYLREGPDVAVSVRAGKLRRRLEAIKLASPELARALGAAYGHEGAKWAWHRRGRIVALFQLTESGKALTERAKRSESCSRCGHARSRHAERVEVDDAGKRTRVEFCMCSVKHQDGDKPCTCSGYDDALELSDAERLRTEVEIDGITNGRDAIRRQLITRAEREAEALLERALRAWVAT
jgi:hypothetical protein